jgi:hypothetical protein
LCIAAAASANFHHTGANVSAILAVLHSLATSQAAPINFRQRKVAGDNAVALAEIFDSFSRWQAIRCVLQVVNLGVSLWALIAYLK